MTAKDDRKFLVREMVEEIQTTKDPDSAIRISKLGKVSFTYLKSNLHRFFTSFKEIVLYLVVSSVALVGG